MNFIRRGHKPDYFLIAVVFLLTVGGLLILTSASSDLGKIRFNDSYYYLKHQLIYGLFLGLLGFIATYFIPYTAYRRYAFPLILASIACLVLVFTPLGLHVRNASRWVALGPFSFQPAEILKLTFIMYVAAWLSGRTSARSRTLEGFLPFAAMLGVIGILLVLQPATSTVVILMTTALIIYFVSGAKIKYLLGIIGVGIAGLALLVLITPYRLARVMTYLDQNKDTQGAGYHINQARIAIGSGRLSGVGFGQSTTKVSYLPAPIDDSIFAVAAEEFGFLGSGTIVVLFAALVFRMYQLAFRIKDQFGRYLLIGYGSVIALQSIVNMAAISGLLPLTGVPLPFVSYGGTALAIFLTIMGISVNISKNTR